MWISGSIKLFFTLVFSDMVMHVWLCGVVPRCYKFSWMPLMLACVPCWFLASFFVNTLFRRWVEKEREVMALFRRDR